MAASVDEIGLTLGIPSPTSDQIALWGMWVADAGRQVVRWAAQSGYQYAALDQTEVDAVVRETVVAWARAGDGATEVSVSVDDGQVTRKYPRATERLVPSWLWSRLVPVDASGGVGAFTITPRFESGYAPGSERW